MRRGRRKREEGGAWESASISADSVCTVATVEPALPPPIVDIVAMVPTAMVPSCVAVVLCSTAKLLILNISTSAAASTNSCLARRG